MARDCNIATDRLRTTSAITWVQHMEGWLEKIAQKNPDKAADLFLRALEYRIPKLARTETLLESERSVATRLVIKRPTDG